MVGQAFRGEWVWKVSSLPKIKCFLWQCCHHSIPIQALLSKRGMDIPFLCPVCNNAPETIIHALRDCPKAQFFWSSFSLLFQSPLFFFYGSHLVGWLKLNCKSSRTYDSLNIAWGTNPGSMASPFSQLVQVEYGWLLPG